MLHFLVINVSSYRISSYKPTFLITFLLPFKQKCLYIEAYVYGYTVLLYRQMNELKLSSRSSTPIKKNCYLRYLTDIFEEQNNKRKNIDMKFKSFNIVKY